VEFGIPDRWIGPNDVKEINDKEAEEVRNRREHYSPQLAATPDRQNAIGVGYSGGGISLRHILSWRDPNTC
jgi:hypothetical protein